LHNASAPQNIGPSAKLRSATRIVDASPALTLTPATVSMRGRVSIKNAATSQSINPHLHAITVEQFELFDSSVIPVGWADTDATAVALGMQFSLDAVAQAIGVKVYRHEAGDNLTALLYEYASATLLTSKTFVSVAGWQTVMFDAPVALNSFTYYMAAYYAPVGRYSYTAHQHDNALVNRLIHADVSAGRYGYGTPAPQMPDTSYNSTGYGVDVVISAPIETPPRLMQESTLSAAVCDQHIAVSGIIEALVRLPQSSADVRYVLYVSGVLTQPSSMLNTAISSTIHPSAVLRNPPYAPAATTNQTIPVSVEAIVNDALVRSTSIRVLIAAPTAGAIEVIHRLSGQGVKIIAMRPHMLVVEFSNPTVFAEFGSGAVFVELNRSILTAEAPVNSVTIEFE
jgi:hypothetical protein